MRVLIVASSEQELQGLSRFAEADGVFLERLLPCGKGEIVAVPVGVGLVQASLGTFAAILKWGPDHVICFGTGGAVCEELELGSLVYAEEVVQYSMDLRPFGLKRGETFGAHPGVVVGSHRPMMCVPSIEGVHRMDGVVGSADMFAVRSWRETNSWLRDELHVILTDMESYAMVSVCRQCYIPCCVLRVVSDTADGRRPKNYSRFMTETVGTILVAIIESIKEKF